MNNKEYIETLRVCGKINTTTTRIPEVMNQFENQIKHIEESDIQVKELMDRILNSRLFDMKIYKPFRLGWTLSLTESFMECMSNQKEFDECMNKINSIQRKYEEYIDKNNKETDIILLNLIRQIENFKDLGGVKDNFDIFKVIDSSDIMTFKIDGVYYTIDDSMNELDDDRIYLYKNAKLHESIIVVLKDHKLISYTSDKIKGIEDKERYLKEIFKDGFDFIIIKCEDEVMSIIKDIIKYRR